MRFEFVRMRPGDHLGWAFAGAREFAALATSCLLEGAALGERLMYVAEHPDPSAVAALAGIASKDDLKVASIGDVYGTSGIVDAETQVDCFAAELDAALAVGYSGLRVVCDVTPLVTGEAAMAAWRRYELLADQFTAVHQVTALCAYDGQRLGQARLAELAALHPLSSASGPVPPFRLFFQGRMLRLAGPVTTVSLARLRRALAELPAGTPAIMDLGGSATGPADQVAFDQAASDQAGTGQRGADAEVIAMLHDLVAGGTPVTVLGPAAMLAAVRAAVPPPGVHLDLRQY